jgi:hypothetical protein
MARVVTLTICPPIDSQCPCFRVARPTTTTADPGPRLGKCRSADVADCGNLLIMSAQVPADLHRWRSPAAFQTGAPELDDLRAVLPEADLVLVRRCRTGYFAP